VHGNPHTLRFRSQAIFIFFNNQLSLRLNGAIRATKCQELIPTMGTQSEENLNFESFNLEPSSLAIELSCYSTISRAIQRLAFSQEIKSYSPPLSMEREQQPEVR